MLPTFQPGQVLYVRPEARQIRPGDVIVYRFEDKYIVHRVESVNKDGYRTRGDNNAFIDEAIVPPEQVIGVVDEVDTGNDMHSVSGGHLALRVAQLRWLSNHLFNSIRIFIGAPYRWLRALHWVNQLWQPEVTKIYLNTDSALLVKYIYRGKTVACWSLETQQFTCQKPFDLVIFPPQ
jgi:signal peptidase I